MNLDDDLVVNTTSNLKVYFLHDQKFHRLCRAVLSLLHQKNCVLNLALVSPKTMQGLNQKFRQKNSATDVLSFSQLVWQTLPTLSSGGKATYQGANLGRDAKILNASDQKTLTNKISKYTLPRFLESRGQLLTKKILGDLAICPHVALRNARHLGHGIDREFGFLLVHGILHLCGYDHEEKKDEEKMLSIQRKIMDEISIMPQPLWQGCLRRVSK